MEYYLNVTRAWEGGLCGWNAYTQHQFLIKPPCKFPINTADPNPGKPARLCRALEILTGSTTRV